VLYILFIYFILYHIILLRSLLYFYSFRVCLKLHWPLFCLIPFKRLIHCSLFLPIKWKKKNATLSNQFQNPIENRSRKRQNRYLWHTNTWPLTHQYMTSNTQIHYRWLSWLGTGTSIKTGGVTLFLGTQISLFSDIMQSYNLTTLKQAICKIRQNSSVSEWVNDCYLTPSKLFSSYVTHGKNKLHFDEMVVSALY
jgi:hypothetical protein